MTDIVTKLREAAPWAQDGGPELSGLLTQAADDIDRLRELLAAYVADEDRFNAGKGEPYGSIATETGIRARAAMKQD